MPKKGKKFTCNLARNFSIAFSRKAITQSKVPNFTIFEDMDAELFAITLLKCVEFKDHMVRALEGIGSQGKYYHLHCVDEEK